MKKIIVESHIPYMQGLLEPFAQVQYLDASCITREAVSNAHALLVRTRTRCNEQLLAGSSVSFVGTATIGVDHIDLAYCGRAGIVVANAPGCNAPAVAQWVHCAIAHWLKRRGIASPRGLTLGIVGVGHVGTIVARWARELGFDVLLNDPLRAEREGDAGFVSLSELKALSHIITFHTPLTVTGPHATHHLCDARFLQEIPHCGLLLNAARGGICDNEALLQWGGDIAIDCWEHEPSINGQLLVKAMVATPHIAGYSIEGKRRGTAMVIEALNHHFGFTAQPPVTAAPLQGASGVSLERIVESYHVLADTQLLKAQPLQFEALRNHYALRHELQ